MARPPTPLRAFPARSPPMSPHRPSALLAGLAVAAPAHAGSAAADARPGVLAADVVAAGQKLGPAPDRHLDVAAVRRIRPRAARTTAARTVARRATVAAAPFPSAGKA